MALVALELQLPPASRTAWSRLPTYTNVPRRGLLVSGARRTPFGPVCVNYWDLESGDVLLAGRAPAGGLAAGTTAAIYGAQRLAGCGAAAAAWYHVALYLDGGLVAESRTQGGVQLVTLSHFLNRNRTSRIAVRRHRRADPGDGHRLERAVIERIGTPYRSLASLAGKIGVRFRWWTRPRPGADTVATLAGPAVCSELAYGALAAMLRARPFAHAGLPLPADFAESSAFVDIHLHWVRFT